MRDKRVYLGTLIIFYALGIILMGYFIPRTQFGLGFFIFALLFGLYLLIYDSFGKFRPLFRTLILLSLLFRFLLLLAIPALSDDIYRFIWDGHLLLNGMNPFVHTPTEALPLLQSGDPTFYRGLYEQLNSPDYFSVYPPPNQLIFWMAAAIGQENLWISTLVVRLILLGFEVGVILLLYILSKQFKKPTSRVLLYALNPLVILEITGNLHFEGVVLFFLLLTFWLWHKKSKRIGLAYGMAIGIKLTPIVLAPLLYFQSESTIRKWLLLGTMAVLLLAFLPLGADWGGFWEGIKLYHGKFEFNASIYFLVRDVAMQWMDYNPIVYLSPILTLLTALLVLWIVFQRVLPMDILQKAIWCYLIYFLLHTVVHPWYILIPLGISVLTHYRSLVLWSLMIFTSYEAYSVPEVETSAALRFIQYAVLAVALLFDIRKGRPGVLN
ncbi:glycosyltransferase 87 family protein [Pleomorphovibrio marinus]|uniref:glycosyltransferase 87 family protein n=1 Tax=Pleomorphovibrio marinus TaxID=2164132 RepID=UPI000E0A0966|nr:glycosyltransferase 87 family protein [Pleomorphovibrio marinus]